MIVRRPKFDFANTQPRWAAHWEFAQMFNAQSMLFPPLERFLNRVMLRARGELNEADDRSAQLRRDINLFVQQEGVHHATHSNFNQVLERAGFTKLPELERQMEEEYRGFLKTKSLKFLTAYCDGFETLGPIFARIYLDEIDDLFEGSDPAVVAMWKWHLLEEFEHRHVCFDVYKKLFGGYFYRIYILIVAHRHMGAYVGRVQTHIFEREWSRMSAEEVRASKRRLKALRARLGKLALPRMLKVLMPFYSPHGARRPDQYGAVLRALEAQYV